MQPPLTDRELVDMFMGTLEGPFFNFLIRSSSLGFTELILTGERVESGIKSGKIQMVASSSTMKKHLLVIRKLMLFMARGAVSRMIFIIR